MILTILHWKECQDAARSNAHYKGDLPVDSVSCYSRHQKINCWVGARAHKGLLLSVPQAKPLTANPSREDKVQNYSLSTSSRITALTKKTAYV